MKKYKIKDINNKKHTLTFPTKNNFYDLSNYLLLDIKDAHNYIEYLFINKSFPDAKIKIVLSNPNTTNFQFLKLEDNININDIKDISNYKLHLISYHYKDSLHRSDGPALITIDIFTGSARHYYLLNNYFLEKEDYDMVINNIKNDQIVMDTNSLVLIEGFKLAADFYNKPDLITELIKKEVLIKLLGEEI